MVYSLLLVFGSTAVGVDLGTTFSVVGIYKNGKVEIVTDKGNHQIFPSIVSYLDNGGNFFCQDRANGSNKRYSILFNL